MGTHTRDSALARVTQQLEAHLLELASHRSSRLPSEREMAKQFGASRSTVREAIQRLIARGLLTARPGSGVFVTSSHPVEPATRWLQLLDEHPRLRGETLEFRSIFECCVARFAAQRANREEKARLRRVMDDMTRAVQDQDIEAEAQTDAQFHLTLAAISHNFMLTQFYAVVINQLREHITHNTYDANQDTEHAHERSLARLAQHAAIHDAIRDGQPECAAQAMARHLAYVSEQFSGSF